MFDHTLYASLNVTYDGQNGDMEPILIDLSDDTIRDLVQEAIRNGNIPGIRQDPGADLTDYRVERFAPTEDIAFHRRHVRPKVMFG